MREIIGQLRQQLSAGSRVLCAVSGGADSMCLLHLLWKNGPDWNVTVLAAHYHHGLRGEYADRDAAFVEKWCREREIPCMLGQGNTALWAREQGLSLEEAARYLRYAFLERCAQERQVDHIAVAHHREDSAETLLINLCRGTGLAGLGGIPTRRGKIIRPLLTVSRQEIEDYLTEHEVPHIHDESNEKDFAARNVLRQQVLPRIEELWPGAQARMARTTRLLREENDALEQWAASLSAEAVKEEEHLCLSCQVLQKAPAALQPRILLHLLDRLEAGRQDVGYAQLMALCKLCGTGCGQVALPGKMLAYVEDDKLILGPAPQPQPRQQLLPGEKICWGKWCVVREQTGNLCLWVPPDAVLSVGTWQHKDRMCTETSRGSRSLKRLFADAGISPLERDGWPVFYVDEVPVAIWEVGTDPAFLPREGKPCLWLSVTRRQALGKSNFAGKTDAIF